MRSQALLLCLLLIAQVAAQNSSDSGFGAEQDELFASNASFSSSGVPQCQLCANGIDCSEAYYGEYGQYCNMWIDKQEISRPCCCPLLATCKPTMSECLCSSNGDRMNNVSSDDMVDLKYIYDEFRVAVGTTALWWIFIVVVLFVVVVGGGCMVMRQMLQRRREQLAAQSAADTAYQVIQHGKPGYYPQQGTYVPPGSYVPPDYENDRCYNNSRGEGMGAGIVAAGVGGGMFGGTLLKDTLESGDDGGDDQKVGGGDFDSKT